MLAEPSYVTTSRGFASWLIQARKARGWTRPRLARESGVSYGTIYAIESGRNGAGLETASLLVTALGYRWHIAKRRS
jgi:transcriptional regulator with XRE-family HTH domain